MNINKKLLRWYDKNKRDLPWRKDSNNDKLDPYFVWISEIMLQQTTVNKVVPYFKNFINKYPDLFTLAKSSVSDVLELWAGLGYYARARNLHKCANVIVKKHYGVFPNNIEDLLELPGIGDYTAGAIISIAYNKLAFPVDVNIKRVVRRLINDNNAPKKDIKNFLKKNIDLARSGDFIESLMDLGAIICKARSPCCEMCPLNEVCETYLFNKPSLILKKQKLKKKPIKYGVCLIVEHDFYDKYYFVRMPEKGLYGGMLSFPTSNWFSSKKLLKKSGFFNEYEFKKIKGDIIHIFSHFKLVLTVYYKKGIINEEISGNWIKIEDARPQLSSLMKKVADKSNL